MTCRPEQTRVLSFPAAVVIKSKPPNGWTIKPTAAGERFVANCVGAEDQGLSGASITEMGGRTDGAVVRSRALECVLCWVETVCVLL